jgi:hypothetical protein
MNKMSHRIDGIDLRRNRVPERIFLLLAISIKPETRLLSFYLRDWFLPDDTFVILGLTIKDNKSDRALLLFYLNNPKKVL